MVEISRASLDRLTPLASVLGRSFVVEPMMLWSLGDRGDVAERLTQSFARTLENLIPLDMVWEAGVAEGAAIWVPPSGAAAWKQTQLGGGPPDASEPEAEARYSGFWTWVESRLPTEPLWHLDAVAVDPVGRGRGIGAALIEHGLAMARADLVGVVLETGNPGNVPYYERFGFRVVDKEDAPLGGPTVWFMRWDPPGTGSGRRPTLGP